MFGKSIYKKLAEDFGFVKDYGYTFLDDVKHYVHPSILFKGNRYKIEIGFSYEDNRFFVNLHDSSKKRHPREDADTETKRIFGDGIDECKNILEGFVLHGNSYKEQVEQVKAILLNQLQKLLFIQ